MSPDAEIALAALAFTVFVALAGLIWRAAIQHGKVRHLSETYVAIHRRIDDLEKQLVQIDKTMAVLVDRSSPPPSPRTRPPLPRDED